MGTYLHYFKTQAEFNEAYKENYFEPWVSCISGNSITYNFARFVDLGLPSGNIWSTMDVGAASPYKRGTLYRWGEITPYDAGNQYIYGASSPYSKYNTTDGKDYLDWSDDIVCVVSGETQVPVSYYPCMPSSEDFQELYVNTVLSVDKAKDITILTSKYNGKQIIFPGNGTKVANAEYPYFFMWAANLNTAYSSRDYAYGFSCYADSGSYYYGVGSTMRRTSPASIRGVLKIMQK